MLNANLSTKSGKNTVKLNIINPKKDLMNAMTEMANRHSLTVNEGSDANSFNVTGKQDDKCKNCHLVGCDTLKLIVVGGYFIAKCKNNPEGTNIGSIPFDRNVVYTIGKPLIRRNMFENIEIYITCLDTDFIKFIVDNMYFIIKSSGSHLFIYNGTTRLWTRCSVDHSIYVISNLSFAIIQEMIDLQSKILQDFRNGIITKEMVENPSKFEDQTETIILQLKKLQIKTKKKSFISTSVKTLISSSILLQPMELSAGDPLFFPIKGGNVINLSNGDIINRNKHHYFSIERDLTYLGPDYNCEHIYKFLYNIFQDDEKVQCFQMILGYCLTGDTESIGLWILSGVGNNGKTVMMDILKSVLGEFYTTLMPQALMGKSRSGATPELMALLGKRLAVISETSRSEKFNEPMLKKLTGADPIPLRDLYCAPIIFKNAAKLFLLTNEPPDFDPTISMLRRIKMFLFNTQFKRKEEYDALTDKTGYGIADSKFCHDLKTKYLDEVFTFLVNGSIKYFKNGKKLIIHKSFQADMEEYRQENDHLAACVAEDFETGSDFKILSTEMLKYFNDWSHEHKVDRLNARSLKEKMVGLGFTHKRVKKGTFYFGLRLKMVEI